MAPTRQNRYTPVTTIRKILQRYAIIFTVLASSFTILNVAAQWYFRSVDRSTMLSSDPTLVERQLYLRNMSNGGVHYKYEYISNNEFSISLIVLMNFYENTIKMVDSFMLISPVVRSYIKCPMGKHVRMFLLGKEKPGYWYIEKEYFDKDQFPRTMIYYETLGDIDKDCDELWKPVKPISPET